MTTGLDDANVVEARLGQPGARDETGEAAPHEGDGNVVVQGRALGVRQVGVLGVVRQLALQLEVLGVPVRPDPLRPLLGVPALERCLVESRRAVGDAVARRRHRPPSLARRPSHSFSWGRCASRRLWPLTAPGCIARLLVPIVHRREE